MCDKCCMGHMLRYKEKLGLIMLNFAGVICAPFPLIMELVFIRIQLKLQIYSEYIIHKLTMLISVYRVLYII